MFVSKIVKELISCWLVFLQIQNVYTSEIENESNIIPVSEEPIKYVHALVPGEREYLSPNLIGVQNIATTFLPLSMNFINIIDAFREIVNGVRYEILLNAVNTAGDNGEIICRLVILEKPWLVTEWGDKLRKLQYSNCSSDALDNDENGKKEMSNIILADSNYLKGTRNQISTNEMKDLENQVITSDLTKTTKSNKEIKTHDIASSNIFTTLKYEDATNEDDYNTESASATISTTTVSPSKLNSEEKQILDDFFSQTV